MTSSDHELTQEGMRRTDKGMPLRRCDFASKNAVGATATVRDDIDAENMDPNAQAHFDMDEGKKAKKAKKKVR